MFGIEIKVSGTWKAVSPPGGPPPYSFSTKPEAETMARILYPALVKMKAGGGVELIRITTKETA